ncbi:hypothetical protein RND81_04G186400 [Saponaria officinalis]|uniref:Uncharacterized protein n=1 Tax=Saponaria officinalis TaxID=3572 RepID=A0AAW1LJ85_SAPOF
MTGEKWTRAEDKLFEEAIVLYSSEEAEELNWSKIGRHVPGRSLDELREHYYDLVHDVRQIESGRVELPSYSDDFQICFADKSCGNNSKQSNDLERKRGTPWSPEEHRLFLLGLDNYGKGDWRSISRNVVITRTPTQVASHAQKYFLRQNSVKKERKRTSIHDITTVQHNLISPPKRPTLHKLGASPQYRVSQPGDSIGYLNLEYPM